MSKWVLWGTTITHFIFNHFGASNIAMVAVWALLAAVTGKYEIFLYATSFTHYLIYISTYHMRDGGLDLHSYGEFKRNCVFWKSFALSQAFGIYAYHHLNAEWTGIDTNQVDYASLAMIATGFALSSAATAALGWDRTYFGWELGALSGKFITTWPYGPRGIPHPMIAGGVLAWLGFYKLAAMTASFPYLALGHVALYLTHMAQEHLAIYHTGEIQKHGEKTA